MSQLSQEHFFLPGLIFIKGLKDFEQDFTPFQIQILSVSSICCVPNEPTNFPYMENPYRNYRKGFM